VPGCKPSLGRRKLKIDSGDPWERKTLVESLVRHARLVAEVALGLGGVPEGLKHAAGVRHRVAQQNQVPSCRNRTMNGQRHLGEALAGSQLPNLARFVWAKTSTGEALLLDAYAP